ncbi:MULTISPECIES: hypothetical protein [Vibrio harveyi group]|uniref:hypothetical protein n=1 Tax=Vibrio harveyi group TaxID=717610 RepID=UPI001B83D1A4|nr:MULTISPECIES: hypothetical protein [Vibrio harveyi group]MCR9515634.1 hypothetical protein [Vibrio alginolyticus]MCR9728619.1 hypothetical protein [Vibrio parahaemolyticus]MCR9753273.1 hypothetical protein [Vibrio parahaemolyticus]MCR9787849.1 hypothetical protein [Vibrio parahaemolyticus]MCR9863271.1 hypothetical protein [Vibrio parahaemolyticus]
MNKKYSVDVYYNSNETVLRAVKNYIEFNYSTDCVTYNGFLFIQSALGYKIWSEIVRLLESDNVDEVISESHIIDAEQALEYVNKADNEVIRYIHDTFAMLENGDIYNIVTNTPDIRRAKADVLMWCAQNGYNYDKNTVHEAFQSISKIKKLTHINF